MARVRQSKKRWCRRDQNIADARIYAAANAAAFARRQAGIATVFSSSSSSSDEHDASETTSAEVPPTPPRILTPPASPPTSDDEDADKADDNDFAEVRREQDAAEDSVALSLVYWGSVTVTLQGKKRTQTKKMEWLIVVGRMHWCLKNIKEQILLKEAEGPGLDEYTDYTLDYVHPGTGLDEDLKALDAYTLVDVDPTVECNFFKSGFPCNCVEHGKWQKTHLFYGDDNYTSEEYIRMYCKCEECC